MENLEPTRNGTLRCFTWSFRSCRRIWEALQIVECLSGHEPSEKFFRWQLQTFGNLQPEVHLCFDESDLCTLLILHSLSHAFSEFELFGLSFWKMKIKIQTGLRNISVLTQLMKLYQYQDLHASWSFWPYKCLCNFASIQRECLKPWSWSTSPARRQPGSQSARWWPIWGPWTSFWRRFPPNRRPRRLQRKYNCQRKKCSAPAQPRATLCWWWAHAPSWGIGRRTEASPCARHRSSIRNG